MHKLSILLWLAVALTAETSGAQAVQVNALLGSKANDEIVQQADRVEACPLLIDWAESELENKYITYEGTCLSLNAADASFLKKTLLAAESYTKNPGKKDRAPVYHFRVRFLHGNDRVEVDFHFSSDLLLLHHGSKTFGQKDFDPAGDQLFAVLLRLFPKDPTMLLVKDERGARSKTKP